LVSTDRRILQANQALCGLLEKSEVDLLGTELTEIVHPKDVNVLRAKLAMLLNGGGTGFTVELRCRHSQGLAVWALLDGSFFNTLARRIQSLLRAPDVVARLGGDEFAILVENLHSDQDVIDLAERLQRALRLPIRLGSAEVTTSVSIGITTCAFSYDSPDDVM